jgi:hypothetical protein
VNDHPFASLPERGKEPTAARHLDAWIEQAVPRVGVTSRRLGWMVASSVAIGVLQRSLDPGGEPRFLLKGGAYLELILGLRARSTSDIDALFRGDFDDLLASLDACLEHRWGPLTIERTEALVMENVQRVAKPRRFKLKLKLGGTVWRSIDVEVAADEAGIGERSALLKAVPLGHFGLPTAESLAGIALDFQVAQKIHACTDPHEPPTFVNTRARDVVDLLLLEDAFYRDAATLSGLRSACETLFQARAADAVALEIAGRAWPPTVMAHEGWERDFAAACREADLDLDLQASLDRVNEWIRAIAED